MPPELNLYDRNPLGRMYAAINTLSLAFFYSDDEKYAAKAVHIIRSWFLDDATRMNPIWSIHNLSLGATVQKAGQRALSIVTLLWLCSAAYSC